MRRFERIAYLLVILLLLPYAMKGIDENIHRVRFREYMTECKDIPHCAFWIEDYGGPRRDLTRPLGEREQVIWNDVLEGARERGFQFDEPEASQTTEEADRLPVPPSGAIYGVARWSNRITFSTEDVELMTDDEVCYLMAHELGHQIDNQTERLDHPFFQGHEYQNRQDFADAISIYLCGQEAHDSFKENWKMPWWRYMLTQ